VTEESLSGAALGGWKVRLECGHYLALPWNASPAAMMAWVLDHDLDCPEETVAPFARRDLDRPIAPWETAP